MTYRERMRKALNYEEPDRLPIDNGGVVSGMHEVAYRNLLGYLGMEDTITIYDPVQRLALVKDEILDLLGVDTRYIFANPPSSCPYPSSLNTLWLESLSL